VFAGLHGRLYGKYPRIDKELLLKYCKGLIATTCCLAAEVPRTILRKGEAEGEKVFKWWLDLFGEDYYIELQTPQHPEQEKVNEVLLRFAKKYKVKIHRLQRFTLCEPGRFQCSRHPALHQHR
jgi:DNA polymerase-3 subunit alpha